jgi:DNA mismatch repair ATPase MutS
MSPPKDLLSILKTRREYCRAMLALAQHQKTLINEDRTKELIEVLRQKQRVIDGIARLNELATEWKQSGKTLTAEESAEATFVRTQADALFDQVRALEQEGVEALARHRDELQRKLCETNQVTDSLPAGYRTGDASHSMFLDFSR